METWQKELIKTNLDDLIDYTKVSYALTARLRSHKLLSNEDTERLQATPGESEKARMLYEILQTRTEAYKILLDVLLNENQSGAFQILSDGQREHFADIVGVEVNEVGGSEIEDNHSVSDTDDEKEIEQTFIEPINGLKRFIESKSGGKLILISTPAPILTATKIKDTLHQTVRIETLETLRQRNSSFSYLTNLIWSNNSGDCQIEIFYDALTNKNGWETEKSLKLIRCKDFANGKIIVVAIPEDMAQVEEYKRSFISDLVSTNQVAVFVDHFRWEHLSKGTKKKILHMYVVDQGKKVKLKTFCKSYVYENQAQFHQTILNGNLLVDLLLMKLLLKKESPVIFRQTIPPLRGNYIPRRLTTRYQISKGIFQSFTKDEIFVFDKMENLKHLKKMAGNFSIRVQTVSNALEENGSYPTAQFLLLEYENDFKNICQKFPFCTIHRLKLEGNNFVWIETKGMEMKILHLNIADKQKIIPEKEFLTMVEEKSELETLVLCDTAGMGKSVLLASLAEETRKRNKKKGSIVLFFVMTDFISAVKSKLEEEGIENKDLDTILLNEINLVASTYDLENNLFSTSITQSKLFLFFDGLDEVHVDSLPLALDCFQRLKKIFSKSKLHVTTRPHLLHQVERAFSTLGYNIQEFNPEDQIKFLYEFWEVESKYPTGVPVDPQPVNTKTLRQYTERCLSTIKLTDKENKITGIHLQCSLIGEVFKEEAKRYADPANTQRASDVKPSIRIKSVIELYNQMIKARFQTFHRRFLASENLPLHKTPLEAIHLYLSIDVLFPNTEWCAKLRPSILTPRVYFQLQTMLPQWTEEVSLAEFQQGQLPRGDLVSIGMLYALEDSKLQFLHRSIAENLVAKYATKHVVSRSTVPINICDFVNKAVLETHSKTSDISQKHSIPRHIYEFKEPVVCHFINSMLDLPQSSNDNDSHLNEVATRSEHRENILQACIHSDFQKILKVYVVPSIWKNTDKFKEILLCAARHASTELFELLIPEGKHSTLFTNWEPTLLHVAVESGNSPMVEHLLSAKGFQAVFNKWSVQEKRNLIEVCVQNTNKADHMVISNKCEILEFLVEENPGFLSESTKDNLLSVLQFPVNINLVLILLRQISSEQIKMEVDYNSKTLLQILASYMCTEDYTKFLLEMKNEKPEILEPLSMYRDAFGQTAFQSVIRYMDPNKEVINIFAEANPNFTDNIDDDGYSILWTAIRWQRSTDTVKSLINHRAIKAANKIDKFGRSSIHIAAQHCKEYSILEMLVNAGVNVNLPDRYGNTPVFYAIRNADPNEVIIHLYKLGAQLGHRNKKGETLLHWAAERGKIKIIEHLYRLSTLDVLPDNNGNTPLHHALRSNAGEKLETVKYFAGSYANTFNKEGQTPLMYGQSQKHPDIHPKVISYLETLHLTK